MKNIRFLIAWALALMALSCFAASNGAVITVKVASDSPSRTAFVRGDTWRTASIYEATNSGNVSGSISSLYVNAKGVTSVTVFLGDGWVGMSQGTGKMAVDVGTLAIDPGQTVRFSLRVDIDAGATDVQAAIESFAGQYSSSQVLGLPAVHAAVDALPTSGPTNMSVRTMVSPNDPTIIGFHVEGEKYHACAVLIRAVGPTLAQLGVKNPLVDPSFQLFDSSGKPMEGYSNDDWFDDQAWAFQATGAFPLPSGSKDSALIVWLEPGNYTVQIKGYGTGQGTALLEIYQIPGMSLGKG